MYYKDTLDEQTCRGPSAVEGGLLKYTQDSGPAHRGGMVRKGCMGSRSPIGDPPFVESVTESLPSGTKSIVVYVNLPPKIQQKNCLHFSICACHPCAGAMLIFSVSFQF